MSECNLRGAENAAGNSFPGATLLFKGRIGDSADLAEEHRSATRLGIAGPSAEACATGIAVMREREPCVLHLARQPFGRRTFARKATYPSQMVSAKDEAELQGVARPQRSTHCRRAPGKKIVVDAALAPCVDLRETHAWHAEDAVGLDRRI